MEIGLGGELGCPMKDGQDGGEAKGRDACQEAGDGPGQKGGRTGLCRSSGDSKRNHSGWTSVKKKAEVTMGTTRP